MLEPRGSAHILSRRESTITVQDDDDDDEEEEDKENDDYCNWTFHPDLEYELVTSTAEHDGFDHVARSALRSRQGRDKDDSSDNSNLGNKRKKRIKLFISFVVLVIAGCGNAVTTKLQAIPMYNYPTFLTLYSNLLYIPICFAYIIPVSTLRRCWCHGAIPSEHWSLPKRPFAVMGALDGLATMMQVFAAVYLPGPLLVLLPQATIPLSMFLSRQFLHERFHWTQYVGAVTVLAGLLLVLEPVLTQKTAPEYYCEAVDRDRDCSACRAEVTEEACLALQSWSPANESQEEDRSLIDLQFFEALNGKNMSLPEKNGDDDGSFSCQWLAFGDVTRDREGLIVVWSLVLLASCVPMTVSTLYKQTVLMDQGDLDPIFCNGWIALFQFLFSVLLVVPAAMLASPAVPPADLPRNLWHGWQCYTGHATVYEGCHPDDLCATRLAADYVHLSLLCAAVYSFGILCCLKYGGSSSLLFLAMTLILPTSNLAFAYLPSFLPEEVRTTTPHFTDVAGVAVIVTGLLLYKWADATGMMTASTTATTSTATTTTAAATIARTPAPGATEPIREGKQGEVPTAYRSLLPFQDMQQSFTSLSTQPGTDDGLRDPLLRRSGDV